MTTMKVPILFKDFYEWMVRSFWSSEMDVTLLGLQNAGKTSLLRVLAGSEFTYDSMPTVGFNMKRVQKGRVSIKCWDLGGQPRFRPMWERYCRGVNAILFVVDTADNDSVSTARDELHSLMAHPTVAGIPLLVLGNKCDLPVKLSFDEFIEIMELSNIKNRDVFCYGISAKEKTNMDSVLAWLVQYSKPAK